MHISKLQVENFRLFGSGPKGLNMHLRPGLNLLVGENDSGKSTIIDALRHLLGTTSHEAYRLAEEDFFVDENGSRAEAMSVSARFAGLSEDERSRFCRFLTLGQDGSESFLDLSFEAEIPKSKRRIQKAYKTREGRNGPALDDDARAYLEATYLRPLRDAESALLGGRFSRLAEILKAHPAFAGQETSDFDSSCTTPPSTLVGIMAQAEHLLQKNTAIASAVTTLNNEFLKGLSLGQNYLKSRLGIGHRTTLQGVLQKFELLLEPLRIGATPLRRGLGLQNLLFMAVEMLLLADPNDDERETISLLLLEEPEAHLHPQQQLRLMDFLTERSSAGAEHPVQVILTTHSPVLASRSAPEDITLVIEGAAFSLAHGQTRLDYSDYQFLRRFLDSTKADIFFARAVLLAEGPSEAILVPAIAEALGYSFSKFGVSVVAVGTTGLFRYARIFQRTLPPEMPIRVACLRDLDIIPDEAGDYRERPSSKKGGTIVPVSQFYESEFSLENIEEKRNAIKNKLEGGPVRVFVSPLWTLEFDLAAAGLLQQVYVAAHLARHAKNRGAALSADDIAKLRRETLIAFQKAAPTDGNKKQLAADVFGLFDGKLASKTECAFFLAEEIRTMSPEALRPLLPAYIVDAIEYMAGCRTTSQPGAVDAP